MRHIPNALTFARILCTPYLAWLLTHGRPMPLTAITFFLCGLTDLIDGFLARRFGWGSRLGEALDPVADKLFLVTLYIAMYQTGLMPGWAAALVLGKDAVLLVSAILVFAFTTIRRFPADMWGKVCTVCQGLAALVSLAGAPDYAAIAISTPAAGLHYLWRGWRLLRG